MKENQILDSINQFNPINQSILASLPPAFVSWLLEVCPNYVMMSLLRQKFYSPR
jgi:hypothetical protein